MTSPWFNSLRAFTSAVIAYPALWVGFACFCAWHWSGTSAVLFYEGAATTGASMWQGSIITYLSTGLAGLVIALSPLRFNLKSSPLATSLVAVCCCSGASVIYVTLYKIPPEQVFHEYLLVTILWPILAGIGQNLLFLSWAGAFGRLGTRNTISLVALGSLLGGGMLCAINFLPQAARELMPLAFGVIAALCSSPALKIAISDTERHGFSAAERLKRRPPWKLLITASVAGTAFGVFQGVSFSGGFGEGAWYDYGVAGFFLAALLFAVCVMNLRMNFNHLIYRVSFTLMAFGPLLCMVVPDNTAWGYESFCIGYRLFEMLLWCLCAYLINQRAVSFEWLGGQCMGVLFVGYFIGFETFTLWETWFPDAGTEALLSLMLFCLLVAALFLVSQSNLLEAWGMVRPGDSSEDADTTDLACQQLAKQFTLSTRESEVLGLLAQGKTRAEISNDLTLSEETIKTHMRHLYQKLGVHSRKELDHMIAKRKKDIATSRISLRESKAQE